MSHMKYEAKGTVSYRAANRSYASLVTTPELFREVLAKQTESVYFSRKKPWDHQDHTKHSALISCYQMCGAMDVRKLVGDFTLLKLGVFALFDTGCAPKNDQRSGRI